MWIDLNFNLLTYIALGITSFSLLVQMAYYWGLFSRLAFFKNMESSPNDEQLPPVSVVISARNAVLDLEKNLPYILYQDYPQFEVVVVNDSSDDGTEEFLTELARYEPKLNIVHIRQNLNFFHGKKFPLSLGIKSAKNELLLFTDADCRPKSDKWIRCMISHYQEGTEIVLGYGPYTGAKGLLGFLQRFDTLQIAILYLSKALAGRPYMGVGRNLSYLKSLFMDNKGFISHYNIPSGDDDLFIQQVANKRNCRVALEKASFTFSEPEKTFSSWIHQKRRHLTTGKYYKPGIKFQLSLFAFTQFSFYASLVWLLLLHIHPVFPAGFFLLHYIQQLVIFGKSSKTLHEKFPFYLSPIAEIFFIIFNPLLIFINSVTKPIKWM